AHVRADRGAYHRHDGEERPFQGAERSEPVADNLRGWEPDRVYCATRVGPVRPGIAEKLVGHVHREAVLRGAEHPWDREKARSAEGRLPDVARTPRDDACIRVRGAPVGPIALQWPARPLYELPEAGHGVPEAGIGRPEGSREACS